VTTTGQGENVTPGALLIVFAVLHAGISYHFGVKLIDDFAEDDPKFDRWCRFNPESLKWDKALCLGGIGCFSLVFTKCGLSCCRSRH
jgi:hypothetical protein